MAGVPHSPFRAHAYINGKRTPRYFRDEESARAFIEEQNALAAKARGFDPVADEPLLTWRELGKRLKKCRDSITYLRLEKGMPSIKLSRRDIRYRWSEVQAWMEAERVQPVIPELPFHVTETDEARQDRKFKVEGSPQGKRERRFFLTLSQATDYARRRNHAFGRKSLAPLPVFARGQDKDGPFWRVAQATAAARPDLHWRAFTWFPDDTKASGKREETHRFATEKEAQYFANWKNLEVEKPIALRAELKNPTPPPIRDPGAKAGDDQAALPPLWNEAALTGVAIGHRQDAMKGPPFRIQTSSGIYPYIVVGPRVCGKRHGERKYFQTEREAKTYAHMRNTQAMSQGIESLNFPTALRVMAERCHHMLTLFGKSLEDATAFFVEHLKQTEKGCAIRDLLPQLLKTKKSAGVTKGYLYSLGRSVRGFGEFVGAETMVSEIATRRVADYLDSLTHLSPNSRNCIGVHLRTFFNYAVACGYCASEPVGAVGKAKYVAAPVGIISPEQLKDVLIAAEPHVLPFIAIGAFAGLRVAELMRLDWAQVDLQDGFIEVTALNAKSARRRLVKILPALAAWIAPLAEKEGPVWPYKHALPSYHLAGPLKAAGIKVWPRNALRHSFASYHIAHFKDAAALALEMGHTTTQLIFQHYRQVVRSQLAEGWWNTMPPGNVQVVNFKHRAQQDGEQAAGK